MVGRKILSGPDRPVGPGRAQKHILGPGWARARDPLCCLSESCLNNLSISKVTPPWRALKGGGWSFFSNFFMNFDRMVTKIFLVKIQDTSDIRPIFWATLSVSGQKMGGVKKIFNKKQHFLFKMSKFQVKTFFLEIVPLFIQWQKDGLRTPEKRF